MTLSDYITLIGDDEAAARFNVRRRTAEAWRRHERTPRREKAAEIVATSPVTYEGIYGPRDTDSRRNALEAA